MNLTHAAGWCRAHCPDLGRAAGWLWLLVGGVAALWALETAGQLATEIGRPAMLATAGTAWLVTSLHVLRCLLLSLVSDARSRRRYRQERDAALVRYEVRQARRVPRGLPGLPAGLVAPVPAPSLTPVPALSRPDDDGTGESRRLTLIRGGKAA